MEILSRRKKCPKCGKGTLHQRVKRHLLVKLLLFWIPIKRYKCDMCYAKSYILGDVRQNLFLIEVDPERRIILLEKLKGGLSLNSLNHEEQHALKKLVSDDRPIPMITQSHSRSHIESAYTGHYLFDDEADEFLREVIKETNTGSYQAMRQ